MWLAITALAALAASLNAVGYCRSEPSGMIINGVNSGPIFVRTIGFGHPILMIPSLARGSHDFDELARTLAKQGFMSILPDPRGTGASTHAPVKHLFALADDNLKVVDALCTGRVSVLGHAFGNRVARPLATSAPDRIAQLILLAGGGEATMSTETARALRGSLAQGAKPDAERLDDLKIAFFAKGQDPRSWLTGWFPDAAKLQQQAMAATPTALWWRAGVAPILLVQATEDPVAPPANAEALKRDVGSRLSLVMLRHASHAMLPEQPAAIAAVVADYLKGERGEARLQADVDKALQGDSR
jgi:pimeloyl-ACP methyl ester carboxylesterase